MCHERSSSSAGLVSGVVFVVTALAVLAPVATAIAALATVITVVLAVLVVVALLVAGLVTVWVLRLTRGTETAGPAETTTRPEIGPGVAGLLPPGDTQSRVIQIQAEAVEVMR